MSDKTIFSICGMCSVHCPIQVSVQNGECLFIQGNPHVPGIKGALCPRGAAGLELIKDGERPQFPMIRKGRRGEGRWLKISWDEALNKVAEKIKAVQSQYGGRSILWSDGDDQFSDLFQAFVRGLGSPNYHTGQSTYDINVHHATQSLFGLGSNAFVYDYKNAKFVVFQALNLFESINVKEVNNLLDSLETGCKLAVIDVRATISSAKADQFMLTRPGTDYALNLSVIHVLLDQNLYNSDFAQTWINDLETLRTFVAPFTPAWAEAETGIKADDIVRLVKEMAKAAPAVIWHPGQDTSRYKDSFYVSRTAFIINALLGSIGARGGVAFAATPEDAGKISLNNLSDLLPEVTEARADGVGVQYPVFDASKGLQHLSFQAIESQKPYPVKAYMSFDHDPLSSYPDPAALAAILDKLDLLVCAASNWSQTAWYADIVLPVSSYLEQESILVQQNGLKPYFMVRSRCIDPRLDTRADWEIISGLAKRLNISALSFNSIQDIWKYQLKDTGISMDHFNDHGVVNLAPKPIYKNLSSGMLGTASGKIEIVNSKWEQAQIPSLLPYKTKHHPEPGSFRLAVGRCAVHSHGNTINNPALFRLMSENELWIHSSAADKLNIADGENIQVSKNGFSAAIKARVTEYIHPEAVFMVHGFGRKIPAESRAYGKGVADNALMTGGLNQWDTSGGGLAFQEHFVSVRKI